MQCYRGCMRISYMQHVAYDEVLGRVGQDRALQGQVKSQKLKYFGHVTRLRKNIVLCTMPGTQRKDGQRKQLAR